MGYKEFGISVRILRETKYYNNGENRMKLDVASTLSNMLAYLYCVSIDDNAFSNKPGTNQNIIT